MNELLSLFHSSPQGSGEIADPPELHLRAVSRRSGPELLPALLDAIDRASGWVLHRQMAGPSVLQMRVEAQGRALVHLYAAFAEEGLELARESHLSLTERCSCAYLYRGARSSIVTLSLAIRLRADLPLLGSWRQARMA